MSKNSLRSEILTLEKALQEKKQQLFLERLETIAGKKFTNNNVRDVIISVDTNAKTWQISYLHSTDKYNFNNYAYNEDSENDESESHKDTRIVFGQNSKHYIRGGIKLTVYRNTVGELRVINPDYEFDLDLEEQRQLVRSYASNSDLPEWLAISVFLYLYDNKWDDESLINHLGSV